MRRSAGDSRSRVQGWRWGPPKLEETCLPWPHAPTNEPGLGGRARQPEIDWPEAIAVRRRQERDREKSATTRPLGSNPLARPAPTAAASSKRRVPELERRGHRKAERPGILGQDPAMQYSNGMRPSFPPPPLLPSLWSPLPPRAARRLFGLRWLY